MNSNDVEQPKKVGALDRLIAFVLAAVIIFLPAQRILAAILGQNSNLTSGTIFWLTHWYEFVGIALLFLVILRASGASREVSNSSPPIHRGRTIIYLSLAWLAWGTASVFLIAPSIGQGLEGFRFTVLAVVFLLVARALSPESRNPIVKSYLGVSFLLAVWAIGERLLPLNYWEKWGLIATGSNLGWGSFGVNGIHASAGFIGGSNQLGAYLIPAVIWWLRKVLAIKPLGNRLLQRFALSIALLAIILSLSRSAWLGLVVAIVAFAFIISPTAKIRWIVGVGVVAVAILAGSTYLIGVNSSNILLHDLVTHGASQSQHVAALQDSWQEIVRRSDQIALWVGSGLGTAGPLALKYGRGFVSESWYLQVALELGLVGLLIWLGLIVALWRHLLAQRESVWAASLIGVSFAALFLHTWADNPALTITLFTLIGSTSGKSFAKEQALPLTQISKLKTQNDI